MKNVILIGTICAALVSVGWLARGRGHSADSASGFVRADSAPGETEPAGAGEIEKTTEDTHMAQATFGAGCFWGVEAAFRQVDGVTATEVGYSGGVTENPSYGDVCSDTTGHAEAVRVYYDPSRVSYDKLLEVFWNEHDPTTVDRQGPDIGSQYRSVIFYHDEQQKAAALASKEQLDASGRYARPIVTQIVPAGPFYRAEEYHQQYLEKRGLSTCRIK